MQSGAPELPNHETTPWLDLQIPPVTRATPEELHRRKQLIARAKQIREEIGRTDVSGAALIRQARDEGDAEQ